MIARHLDSPVDQAEIFSLAEHRHPAGDPFERVNQLRIACNRCDEFYLGIALRSLEDGTELAYLIVPVYFSAVDNRDAPVLSVSI